jgi:hypothetical protein
MGVNSHGGWTLDDGHLMNSKSALSYAIILLAARPSRVDLWGIKSKTELTTS